MPAASRTAAIRPARLRANRACARASCGSSSSTRPAATRWLPTRSANPFGSVNSSVRTSRSSSLVSRSGGSSGRGASASSRRPDGTRPPTSARSPRSPIRPLSTPRSRRRRAAPPESAPPVRFVPTDTGTDPLTTRRAKGPPGVGWGPLLWWWVCVRRCPTLPHPGGCSTIGAGGLSFRVRNGSGRFPSAMAAVTCVELFGRCCWPCSESCTVDACCACLW